MKFFEDNEVIRKVKKTQHLYPLFGHKGGEISKKQWKKVHWA
jgi:hypothetical protein